MYLAIVKNGAKDWFTGVKLKKNSFTEDQKIEYHHVFPKKLLNARNVDRYIRDEMANIAILGQRANRSILAKEPKNYLADIAKTDRARLESQYVPVDSHLWDIKKFNDFLVARRKLLASAMNRILKS